MEIGFRPYSVMFRLTAAVLLLANFASGQERKPGHPEQTAERRKALDQLTDSVHSRLPSLAAKRRNYIDEHIFGKAERDKIPLAGLSSDTEFLRRVTLD